MRNHNARNERIKRKYYTWLKEARGQSEATIDQVSSSIDRFDAYAKHADFASFHVEKVVLRMAVGTTRLQTVVCVR
jgi:integrase/recombinase XerD